MCGSEDMLMSKKSWCTFTGVGVRACTCMSGEAGGLERRGAGVPENAINLVWYVGRGVCANAHGACVTGRAMTNDNKMRKAGGWKAKLAKAGVPGALWRRGGGHSVLTAGPSAEL